jgi:hypothetical protein
VGDIELQTWVDAEYIGCREVELNSTVDCGADVAKCIGLDFGSTLFVVPPGRHTVRAEIRKREYDLISSFQSSNAMLGNPSRPFVWGKEASEEPCGWCRRVRILLQSNSAHENVLLLNLFVNACLGLSVHSCDVYDRYIYSAIKMNVYIPFYRPVDVMVEVVRFATE